MILHRDKYINLILYLARKLGGEVRGKKKLAKLLYFADFDYFEKYEQSITGDTYRALPMGPVPSQMTDILQAMEKDELISVTSQEEFSGYEPTVVYKATIEAREDVFSSEEKEMVDRVAEKYGRLTGKELEDLSHAEAPYIGTEAGSDIDYELSFYRETDFQHA